MNAIKLQDFLRLAVCQTILGSSIPILSSEGFSNEKTACKNNYKRIFFLLPRIYCADGFNISIQCNNGSYCASENGTRVFGYDWKLLEWGFPSEKDDILNESAEDSTDVTKTVGGYVNISILQELMDRHGGIDFGKTCSKENFEKQFNGLK